MQFNTVKSGRLYAATYNYVPHTDKLLFAGPCSSLLLALIAYSASTAPPHLFASLAGFATTITTMASSFKIKLKLPPNPNQTGTSSSSNNSPQRSSVPAEGGSSIADGASSAMSEDMGDEGEDVN